jgi:8-oxo-dGTP pyrophosphatase MutT (NUDIX family)
MVYVTREMMAEAEARYGTPATFQMAYPATPREMDLVRDSQKNGRKHDVTLAIFGRPGVIVIAKPWYTRGLYRLPSGGLVPGETLEAGAAREAKEETGVEMELIRYHLRIDVEFKGPEFTIPWTSHVFSARHVAGAVEAEDTEEIREARWCDLSELLAHRALMLESSVSGLRYRAALQDRLLDSLVDLGWVRREGSRLMLEHSCLPA